MTSEEELSEWQPAIITWGCGEPRRPECLAMRGRRVYVRETNRKRIFEADCSQKTARWFVIRTEDLPLEIQADGDFIICEHDLVTD